MRRVTADAVHEFLIARFAKPLSKSGVKPGDVGPEFDLFAEGIVDSLGIMEMMTALEDHFGIILDLEKLDPEEFSVVGPLGRFIEDQAASGSAEER